MSNPITRRAATRLLVGATLAAISTAGAAVLAPSAAWAHVNAGAAPAAGGATKVTFTFDHGCAGAPTTSLRVQLPEGTSGVTPEDPTGWTSTSSASELRWTGGSIPDGQRGSFAATMTIPGQAGETVYLPAIQGCPDGVEEAWIDKTPDAGATTAAQRIVLTTTVTPTSATTSTTTAASSTSTVASTTSTNPPGTIAPSAGSTVAPAPAATSTSSSSTPIVVAAVLVVLALLGVGGYVLSTRSRSNQK